MSEQQDLLEMTPWAAAWSLRGEIIPTFVAAFSFAVGALIIIGEVLFEGVLIPKIVAIPLIVLGAYCAILGFRRFDRRMIRRER